MRRIRNVVFGILWCLLLCLPAFALALALRGELNWHSGLNQQRVWLIQDTEQVGLAWASTGAHPNSSTNAGLVCTQTSVRYYFWRKQPNTDTSNTTYCDCYRTSSDGSLIFANTCAITIP